MQPTAARIAEVEDLLGRAAAWAGTRRDIRALALVGSWARARGAARMASDVDLVLVSDDPRRLLEVDGWWTFLGGAEPVRRQRWGIVVERRLRLPSGLEVELDVAPMAWVALPLDDGTRAVLAAGARVLHDPDGLLASALAASYSPSNGPISER